MSFFDSQKVNILVVVLFLLGHRFFLKIFKATSLLVWKNSEQVEPLEAAVPFAGLRYLSEKYILAPKYSIFLADVDDLLESIFNQKLNALSTLAFQTKGKSVDGGAFTYNRSTQNESTYCSHFI